MFLRVYAVMDLFRQIEIDEVQAYQKLIFDAYQTIRDLDIRFDAANIDIQYAEEHLKQHIVYGLYRDEKLIATVTVRMPWSILPGPFGLPHIGNVAVHPDYKGQGVSKLLISRLEQNVLLKQFKLPAYSLGTASKHPWLLEMYKKLGFQEVRRSDLGKGHITIFMLKILDSAKFIHWNTMHQVIHYAN